MKKADGVIKHDGDKILTVVEQFYTRINLTPRPIFKQQKVGKSMACLTKHNEHDERHEKR